MSETGSSYGPEVEALAESWASIDGKGALFTEDKAGPVIYADGTEDGTYDGYMAEAAEMIRRLAKRGFKLVPLA